MNSSSSLLQPPPIPSKGQFRLNDITFDELETLFELNKQHQNHVAKRAPPPTSPDVRAKKKQKTNSIQATGPGLRKLPSLPNYPEPPICMRIIDDSKNFHDWLAWAKPIWKQVRQKRNKERPDKPRRYEQLALHPPAQRAAIQARSTRPFVKPKTPGIKNRTISKVKQKSKSKPKPKIRVKKVNPKVKGFLRSSYDKYAKVERLRVASEVPDSKQIEDWNSSVFPLKLRPVHKLLKTPKHLVSTVLMTWDAIHTLSTPLGLTQSLSLVGYVAALKSRRPTKLIQDILVCLIDALVGTTNVDDEACLDGKVVTDLTWQAYVEEALDDVVKTSDFEFNDVIQYCSEARFYDICFERRLLFLEFLWDKCYNTDCVRHFFDTQLDSFKKLKSEHDKQISLQTKKFREELTSDEQVVHEVAICLGNIIDMVDANSNCQDVKDISRETELTTIDHLVDIHVRNIHQTLKNRKRDLEFELESALAHCQVRTERLGTDRLLSEYWRLADGNHQIFVESSSGDWGCLFLKGEFSKLNKFLDPKHSDEQKLLFSLKCHKWDLKRISNSGSSGGEYTYGDVLHASESTLRASRILSKNSTQTGIEYNRCAECQESIGEDERHCPFCHTSFLKESTKLRQYKKHVRTCPAKPPPLPNNLNDTADYLSGDSTESNCSSNSQKSCKSKKTPAKRKKSTCDITSKRAHKITRISSALKTLKALVLDMEAAIPMDCCIPEALTEEGRVQWIENVKFAYSIQMLAPLAVSLQDNLKQDWLQKWFKRGGWKASVLQVSSEYYFAKLLFQLDRAIIYSTQQYQQTQQKKPVKKKKKKKKVVVVKPVEPVMKDGCQVCTKSDDPDNLLLCDTCDLEYHIYCLKPPKDHVPAGEWHCYQCEVTVNKKTREAQLKFKRKKKEQSKKEREQRRLERHRKAQAAFRFPPFPKSIFATREKFELPQTVLDQDAEVPVPIAAIGYLSDSEPPSDSDSDSDQFDLSHSAESDVEVNVGCRLCRSGETSPDNKLIECYNCYSNCHMLCLEPPLTSVPLGEWYCPECRSQLDEYKETEVQPPVEIEFCCICMRTDAVATDPFVFCDGACGNLIVHQSCYSIKQIPDGEWLCDKCKAGVDTVECTFCPRADGAFQRTSDKKWAHTCCAQWIPEVYFQTTSDGSDIICGVEEVPDSRWEKICRICRQAGGACINCFEPGCKASYHASCMLSVGLKMGYLTTATEESSILCLRSWCEQEHPP